MISGVTRSRGKCSTELTTRFTFAKGKATKWDDDGTVSSFLRLCGATGDPYTFTSVNDPSVSTFTLVSWSISSIFNAVDADLLTFTSRHAVCESRCQLQNNNRGAQGIVVERDPLKHHYNTDKTVRYNSITTHLQLSVTTPWKHRYNSPIQHHYTSETTFRYNTIKPPLEQSDTKPLHLWYNFPLQHY